MDTHFEYVTRQYKSIQDSREALFNYCKTISPSDFVNENSSFGRGGSIRNLLVHVANIYEFWIANNSLSRNIVYTDYSTKNNIDEIMILFVDIDSFMKDFIDLFHLPEVKTVNYKIGEVTGNADIFKIFTHVITHEFHHKGQILSISRHLGYIPVDTDIIR